MLGSRHVFKSSNAEQLTRLISLRCSAVIPNMLQYTDTYHTATVDMFDNCAMSYLFGEVTPHSWVGRHLNEFFAFKSLADVMLVGIHIRLGDSIMDKHDSR